MVVVAVVLGRETTLVVDTRRSYGGSPKRFCARAARQTLPGSLNFTVGSP